MTATAMDWRTMAPGPDLDAIVAGRVMGWTYLPDHFAWLDGDGVPVGRPDLSTDDAAGLLVLDQFGGIVTLKRMPVDGRDEWHCTIGSHTMWAETLPLAICRAALAATEVAS